MNDPSADADALLDEALAAIRKMPAPDRPTDARVLEGPARAKVSRLSSIPRTLYTRIRHMHPVIRYGMVALVVLAVLLIGFGTRSEKLLLADVADAVAKHKTVRVETDIEPLAPEKRTRGRTIYLTLDYMHARIENPDGTLRILDQAKGIFLNLDPKEKAALIFKFPGKPSTIRFFEILDELEKDKRTTSSMEKLDGSDVVVYRLTKEEMNRTIWVDRKTKLPVRVEIEHLKGPRQKELMTQFGWDPPIANPAQFFSVEPPAGYTVSTKSLQ